MAYGTLNVDSITTSTGQILGGGNATAFKNRIINGGMVIDQRNAGAVVTPSSLSGYSVDRMFYAQDSTNWTIQQSSTVPSSQTFVNSLVVTTTSTKTPSGSTYAGIGQNIEGYNMTDLGWGTANAQTVTLSFWVRSSKTGIYTAMLKNNAATASYAAEYTISSANTWQKITITIAGPTIGTWLTTNGLGMQMVFWLCGQNSQGTPNQWNAYNVNMSTNQVNFFDTSGATFYITGVQLEVGSQATSFDFRDYGRELILCQRYLIKFTGNDAYGGYGGYGAGYTINTTRSAIFLNLPVAMRSVPTLTKSGNNRIIYASGGAVLTVTAGSFGNLQFSLQNGYLTVDVASGTPFTAGTVAAFSADTDLTASLSFTAEL